MPVPPTVLIVENSPVVLARLVSLASDYLPAGSIATAQSGTDAVAAFDRTSPELVILDIGLPGLSGLEVLQHIRRRSARTRVLVFTNSASVEIETACKSFGADHFLDKSKDVGLLVDLLREFGGSGMGAAPVI